MDDLHTHTDGRSFLKTSFASVPRFEFGKSSGGGPPKKRRWSGNLRLEVVSRLVGSVAVEFQCGLLTLAFLQQNPPIRDRDR